MSQYPILQTKLYIPRIRPKLVSRPRLIERLNAGLDGKLTVISAPAGFGKTTLVTQWLECAPYPSAWLSLDESDSDATRFLAYFVTALRTIEPREASVGNIGQGALSVLQSLQPPPAEAVLTSLINDVVALPDGMILVLDDYHLIEAQVIHDALTFLLEHLPPQMHLVIATRQDPSLPLARLRARGQLTELRASDLRFTSAEAAEFLNQVMGLDLSAEDIAALEARTEGWIAGLQLAAISMQRREDTASLIKSFAGSHRYVLDYLVEEVLEQQSERVQTFLLRTSILDRLCASLCDAVRFGSAGTPTGQDDGQAILEMLDRANLFIVPLDNERCWYRYHRLFADLLRQRLQNATSSTGAEGGGVDEYHRRASLWHENKGLEIEAFQHAVAASDIERAERLMKGAGMPLQYRGAMIPVMNWLASLPTTVLDARPSLWVTYASALTMLGQPISSVEEKLQAAEAALAAAALQDAEAKDLLGQVASIRAMLAIPQYQVETIITQSQRALEYLHPDNLPVRTAATWTLGYAYQLQGDRAAASRAYTNVISIGQASGNIMLTIGAATGLGQIQEGENQLYVAAESYRHVLQLAGDPPLPTAAETYLGLARIYYQWNDLDVAQQNARQGLQLARQMETVDTPAACEAFLARLKLAQGDVAGAAAILTKAEQFMRQRNFVHRMPEVAAAQVRTLLLQGNLAAAGDLAEEYELPISQARVHLAQGDTGEALAVLGPLRRQVEAKGWPDERLKVLVLQAVAHQRMTHPPHGEEEEAVELLGEALAMAEQGGFIRIFVDEGPSMARLLYEAHNRGIAPDYVRRLLAAFPSAEPRKTQALESELVEPLSERELEVLQLIAEGLSNPEIASRLHLSLHTVKTHARNIYGKLGVRSRTQAVARARALGVLPFS